MLKKRISLLVFIWSVLLFFLNLRYDFTSGWGNIVFWFSIIIIFGTIIYQIFYLKYTNNVVLFEIFIVYLSLHLIYQVGYFGLRGSDSYKDYNFFKTILNNHNFNLGQGVDGWPMLHIFSSIVCILTKIEPLIIAKFLPSFISAFLVLPLYLLCYNIYKDKRVALFSCLIYGTIPQFMRFEGLFVRETFALFIMILFFYIIYVSKQRRDYRFTLLLALLIPVIVFSHHFTCFMFIILLGIYIIAYKAIPYFYRKNMNMVRKLSGRINIETFFFAILVAAFAYWIYHAVCLLRSFRDIFWEVTGVKEIITYAEQIRLESPIVTLRGKIIYYGFYFFHFLFALILAIKLIIQKNVQKIEDFCFSGFFFFVAFCGFLALYVLGSILFPQRFLSFGWMFGIIPLVGLIVNLKKSAYKIFVILLASFIIFNVYNLDSAYYTGNVPRTGLVATEREYSIAKTIKFSEEYYGYGGIIGAVYDVQGIEQEYGGKNLYSSINVFRNSSKIAVIKEEHLLRNLEILKKKSKEDYLKVIEIMLYKNDKNVHKVYDLGNIYVLKGGG